MQDWLKAVSDSGFLKLNGTDMKHLGLDMLLTGSIAAVGVAVAYFTGHDVGTLTPVIAVILTGVASLLKKLATDNSVPPVTPAS